MSRRAKIVWGMVAAVAVLWVAGLVVYGFLHDDPQGLDAQEECLHSLEKECEVLQQEDFMEDFGNGQVPMRRVQLRATAQCLELFRYEETIRWAFFSEHHTWWDEDQETHPGVIKLSFRRGVRVGEHELFAPQED